jgi:AcrR family transcriptional regulator
MPENDRGASSDRAERWRELGTPRRELERLRERQAAQGDAAHARFEESVLLTSGELGYRQTTVREVLARCHGNRVQFYDHFSSVGDCYAAAYEGEIDRLVGALLTTAKAQGGWRAGLRAALAQLGRFAVERPLLARGVLVEVHVAGGPAMAKREEVFERLTRAIDSARRETDESRHSPPPITAAFMVSAIEESVAMALVKGEPQRFAASVPELTFLASSAYFGDEIAREELARAGN